MHNGMSKETKEEVMARLRRRYATAGAEHKGKLLDQAVELVPVEEPLGLVAGGVVDEALDLGLELALELAAGASISVAPDEPLRYLLFFNRDG